MQKKQNVETLKCRNWETAKKQNVENENGKKAKCRKKQNVEKAKCRNFQVNNFEFFGIFQFL